MQNLENNEIKTEQNSDIAKQVVSFINRLFKGTPYYNAISDKKTNNLNNKFEEMNKLANKLVAKHMVNEMVKSNMSNPQNGYKLNPNDYAMAFLANFEEETEYYQNWFDKIISFTKKYARQIATFFIVYSNVFITLYESSKSCE